MNIMAVARRARVSTATVSRVINGTAFVAPETAERVRAAIEALNFYPDINARTLGSGRSGMYGLIISDITNPYFPELVKAFEDIAVEHSQEVLIANTNYDPKRMETCVARMLQRKVDGVAIMTSEMDDRLVKTLSKRQIPIVFMDTPATGPGMSVIRVDYEIGVQAAMDHLFALKHRDIAFISGPLTLGSARVREKAFREAMERYGLTKNPSWMQEGDHRVEGGHHAMQRILRSGKKLPTAVLTSNDLTAIGAMGAIHEAGLRIPQDISIVGFDGIELSAYTQPALTTLVVSRGELAAQAFRCLLQHKDGASRKPSTKEQVIEPKLLIRESTAPLTRS
jgi:LacI family transcriptional regulator